MVEPGDTQLEVAAERGEVAAEADCLREEVAEGEVGLAVLGCDLCFPRCDCECGSGMLSWLNEATDCALPLSQSLTHSLSRPLVSLSSLLAKGSHSLMRQPHG